MGNADHPRNLNVQERNMCASSQASCICSSTSTNTVALALVLYINTQPSAVKPLVAVTSGQEGAAPQLGAFKASLYGGQGATIQPQLLL